MNFKKDLVSLSPANFSNPLSGHEFNDKINNETYQIEKKSSINYLESIPNIVNVKSQYGQVFSGVSKKNEDKLIFNEKICRKMVSPNFVQLIPRLTYRPSESVEKIASSSEVKSAACENMSKSCIEKIMRKDEYFELKEYAVEKSKIDVDNAYFKSLSESEIEFTKKISTFEDEIFETVKDFNLLGVTNEYEDFENLENSQESVTNIFISNIPLPLCISYIKQEKLFNKKLHAVWLGYKTRCILSGSLKLGYKVTNKRDVDIKLNYKIHEILLSICDLYNLIKDEEAKGINANTSWIQALYEQTTEFKKKYSIQVNKLLKSEGSWISIISKINNKNKIVLDKGFTGELPSKIEKRYIDKITNYKFKIRGKNYRDSYKQIMCKKQIVSIEKDNFEDICIPFSIANSKSLSEICNFLNIQIDDFSNLIEDHNKNPDKKLNYTPEIKRCITNYFTPRSILLESSEDQLDNSNSDIFYTPKYENSVENPQIKCNILNYDADKFELHTSRNMTELLTENELNYEDRSFVDENNLGVGQKSNIKPKPYLKRKSKSILPTKETDIELKNVTSRVKEIYKSKSLERFVNTRFLNSNEVNTKIPSISPNIKLISNSPSSRNSSSKISRIPKYNGSRASISSELSFNETPFSRNKFEI